VIYRERYEVDPYEERYQNIVLKQQSMFGPWFVMGLGAMLALFLVYLIYSNVLLSPVTLSSAERSLRVITTPSIISAPEPQSLAGEEFLKHGAAVTIVPHSRATNALVGGHGPAALSAVATAAQHGTPETLLDQRILPR
jgi:hypothetical protein